MYSSYQIVIENEPECVNLQDIPILYVNSIALQFKDEQMTEFKVIEFALIIFSMLISMICGARYLIQCQCFDDLHVLDNNQHIGTPFIDVNDNPFNNSMFQDIQNEFAYVENSIIVIFILINLGINSIFFFQTQTYQECRLQGKVIVEQVGTLRLLIEILCCLMNLIYVSYLHYVTVQYCNKEQPIRMQIVQKIMNTIVPII
ncbi:unnamed protein product [Paramecium pentaurelia]|uniref:Transmembrane protein n=1 Tax=Paramecium pentaurelia TaxID=43138 RepID=A0A8S1XJJ6_9CILI|nr:unnamed protein product [Paramecium pentaurelia]